MISTWQRALKAPRYGLRGKMNRLTRQANRVGNETCSAWSPAQQMDVGAIPRLRVAGVDSSKPCRPGLQVGMATLRTRTGSGARGSRQRAEGRGLCGEGVPVLARMPVQWGMLALTARVQQSPPSRLIMADREVQIRADEA